MPEPGSGQTGRAPQPLLGLVAGLGAVILGAGAWTDVVLLSGYRLSLVAIGIGYAVAAAVTHLGHWRGRAYGAIAAVLALLGCLLGDIGGTIAVVTRNTGVSYGTVLSVVPAHLSTFVRIDGLDAVFYGLAAFYAARITAAGGRGVPRIENLVRAANPSANVVHPQPSGQQTVGGPIALAVREQRRSAPDNSQRNIDRLGPLHEGEIVVTQGQIKCTTRGVHHRLCFARVTNQRIGFVVVNVLKPDQIIDISSGALQSATNAGTWIRLRYRVGARDATITVEARRLPPVPAALAAQYSNPELGNLFGDWLAQHPPSSA